MAGVRWPGQGAEFRPELIEQRWLGLPKNLGILVWILVPVWDLPFAWSLYLGLTGLVCIGPGRAD